MNQPLLASLLAAVASTVCAADLPPPGVYRSVRTEVVASGPACGIGTPLAPAYLLRMGAVDDPNADDAIGVLVDDAGIAMPIVRDASGRLDVVDASEPKDSNVRALGKVAPGAEPLAIDVEFGRYDLDCDVRGSVTFAPSAEPADALRVEQLTRAWLLMGVRDARRNAGDPRSALVPARAAEAIFRAELGAAHRLTSMATATIASLYNELDEIATARTLAEAALAGLTAALGRDHVNVLQQANNLALVLWEQGDLAGAEARLRHSVDRYATVLGPDDGRRLGSLTNLASLVAQRGRHVEAEAILRDVLLRRERVFGPMHPMTMVTINNLANVYSASGWLDEADVQLRLASERYQASLGARHPATLRARHNLATVTVRRGETATAAAEYREVLALRREVLGPPHNETLLTQTSLATLLAGQGALEEALGLQRDVVAIRAITSGADNILTLQAEAALGRIESQAGAHADAVPRLQRARTLAAVTLGAHDRATVEIAALFGYAQHAAGDRAGARATLTDVVAAVERWRDSGGFTAARRAVLFAPWVRAYKELAFTALEQNDAGAAFEQAERSKARVLVESLALRRGETPSILPRDALEKLATLDARVTSLEAQQSRATDPAQRLALGQELAAAVGEAAGQRAALRARYPRYAALAQPRLVSAREGAAELAPGTTFASYLVHGDRVLAFTLTRAGRLRGYDLGTVKGLNGLVTAYRALLSAVDVTSLVWKLAEGGYTTAPIPPAGAVRVRDADEIGALLYARLVQPLLELAQAKRWVVSPDGPLALVPFEALPERGKPLVLAREIRYTPSLTVHTLTMRRGRDYARATGRAPLYAMGAALYNLESAAPGRSRDMPQGPKVDAAQLASALADDPGGIRRAFDRLGARWPELPASMQEIETVAAGFRAQGPVVVRARADATEARLRNDDRSGLLARHRYVLLSAHGYLSTETPSLSAVVLGQRDVTPEDDGYVTAAEWAGYTLRSDLIVVSACETGVGRMVEGEGVAGLPYALFVAGNRNALLTLWPVADRSTAAFVVRFFALLRAGRSQADALATVKREFARDARFRAPVHWAPFVLWGS
jgi:CHAT domain-containing protein